MFFTNVSKQLRRATIQHPVTGKLEYAAYRISKRLVINPGGYMSLLPMTAYTGRLGPEGIPFSRFEYTKGQGYGFLRLNMWKGKEIGNLGI